MCIYKFRKFADTCRSWRLRFSQRWGAKSSMAVGTGGLAGPNASAALCCASARPTRNPSAGADATELTALDAAAPVNLASSRRRISCAGLPSGANASRSASLVPCYNPADAGATPSAGLGDSRSLVVEE